MDISHIMHAQHLCSLFLKTLIHFLRGNTLSAFFRLWDLFCFLCLMQTANTLGKWPGEISGRDKKKKKNHKIKTNKKIFWISPYLSLNSYGIFFFVSLAYQVTSFLLIQNIRVPSVGINPSGTQVNIFFLSYWKLKIKSTLTLNLPLTSCTDT